MFSRQYNLGRLCPCLGAVLLVCALPGRSQSAPVYFHNGCKAPVVVQAVCVVRGMFLRSKPYLLKPGMISAGLTMPSNVSRVVTVYNARNPNQILTKAVIPPNKIKLYYTILPGPAGVRMERRPGPP